METGDGVKTSYTIPTKQIKSVDDVMKWEASEAYQVSSLMKTFNPLFCKTLRETLF